MRQTLSQALTVPVSSQEAGARCCSGRPLRRGGRTLSSTRVPMSWPRTTRLHGAGSSTITNTMHSPSLCKPPVKNIVFNCNSKVCGPLHSAASSWCLDIGVAGEGELSLPTPFLSAKSASPPDSHPYEPSSGA